MTPKFTVPALVDPLAVIFSTELYLILQEILHPHVAITDAVKATLAKATAEQRAFILGRAKMVNELSTAVIGAAAQG